ncbi:MAG: putative oxidoreductase C-terminal domain-containing protein [Bacteroidota bacterium]
MKETEEGWEVIIPDKYKEGHESHFARVTENYMGYFKNHNIPVWKYLLCCQNIIPRQKHWK